MSDLLSLMEHESSNPDQFENLKEELKRLQRLGPTPPVDEIKEIFELITRIAASNFGLHVVQAERITSIASEIFKGNTGAIQVAVFDSMRKVITAVADEQSQVVEKKGPVLVKLVRFYTSCVLSQSRTQRLETRAAIHLAKLCQTANPYRFYALGSFNVSAFAEYKIENFEKVAVKCLVEIVTEKLMYNPNSDPLMPGFRKFIDKVCGCHRSCGVIIRVCDAIKRFYEAVALSGKTELFGPMRHSIVFAELRAHSNSFRTETKCWEPILDVMKTSFICANEETNKLLMTTEAYPIVVSMFRIRRTGVIVRLLQLAETVFKAKRDRHTDLLLTNNILMLVLVHVNRPDPVRRCAVKAFHAFVNNATERQATDAVGNGAIPGLLKLMKSSSNQVVLEALRWFFLLMEKLVEDWETFDWFKLVVARLGVPAVLRKLSQSKHMLIKPAARIILSRLDEEGESIAELSEFGERLRLSQRRFFLEGVPPFEHLGVRMEED